MEKTSTTPKDYDYVVFHQPNGKFPMRAAATLGFTEEQLGPGFVVPHLGNTYSGSAMMGLAAVLDVAEPGERILMASFGSGAGSDAFEITVLDEIEELRGKAPSVSELLERPTYISYATYARHKGKMKI